MCQETGLQLIMHAQKANMAYKQHIRNFACMHLLMEWVVETGSLQNVATSSHVPAIEREQSIPYLWQRCRVYLCPSTIWSFNHLFLMFRQILHQQQTDNVHHNASWLADDFRGGQ